jgi:hypothetical protein
LEKLTRLYLHHLIIKGCLHCWKWLGATEKLCTDEILAKRMGTAAQTRYEKHFTAALMGQHYTQPYEELLSAN